MRRSWLPQGSAASEKRVLPQGLPPTFYLAVCHKPCRLTAPDPPAACSGGPSLQQVSVCSFLLHTVTGGLNGSENVAIWVSNVKLIEIFSV